jgi:hypothetical protein
MIRLILRLGFWTAAVTAAVPGLMHVDVFRDGVNAETLGQAFHLTMADLATLCARSPSFCQAGETVASMALDQAKTGLLNAYQGIRTQYDKPDAATNTGGIRQP